MSRYSLKFLTIVCVLRLPAVGRPEIWRLRTKQSRNVKIKSDAELLLIVPWTSQVTIYESKLFDKTGVMMMTFTRELFASETQGSTWLSCFTNQNIFYYQGRRDSEQPTSKTFHTSATPQGAITHGKVLQKTIKEWQLGSKQSENRTISRQAKNRQDRFCIWQKTM